MAQWHFKFNGVSDFDDLVRICLERIPQYNQVYPAPKPDVSASLEEMINKGFPPNQNIVWHKTTHSQKKYYWLMKPNGNDEVRVKVSNGGIPSKADRDLRILTSTNECRKIVRQFLLRWDKSGALPGWKMIWTIFNIANYDISERRIKAIHKIIQDYVIRERIVGEDSIDSNLELDDDQMSCNTHSNLDSQDDKCALGIYLNVKDINNEQSPPTTNRIHQDQLEANLTPTIIETTESSSPKYGQSDTTDSVYSKNQEKVNDACCPQTNLDQALKTSENISMTPETSPVFSETSPSKSVTTTVGNKKKRQRRIYQQRESPYAIRQKEQTKIKQIKKK